jgi:hypothetical protein
LDRRYFIPTRVRRIPGGFADQVVSPTSVVFTATRKSDNVVIQQDTELSYFPHRAGDPIDLQKTVDDSHPDWNRKVHREPFAPGDLGGSFFSQRSVTAVESLNRYKLISERDNPAGTNRLRWTYNGYVCPAIAPVLASDYTWAQRDLTPLGTTAIARCKPTNSVANLATFLIELYRDGLPKLFGATFWQRNVDVARKIGDEYLNAEFGWKPLISDVQSLNNAITHAHTVLNQYELGSGSVTRRRYEFPIERTFSVSSPANEIGIFPFNSNLIDSTIQRGSQYIERRTWRRTWFSGAFTYHLPTDYYSRNAMTSSASKARTLLGLDLTPEVLWNAAPWSWAVDWFSNAGDVISNLSDWSTDGLVLKYGYIMEHSFVSYRTYWFGPTRLPGDPSPAVLISYLETKRREPATPFGFGLNWSGLSSRQKAIAAALGLTHR